MTGQAILSMATGLPSAHLQAFIHYWANDV